MRWLRRVGLFVGVLLVAVVAVAASYVGCSSFRSHRGVDLPEVSGPSPVGRRELVWTDPDRADAPTGPDSARALPVWVWYPATTSGRRAAYAPGAWNDLHFGGPLGAGETAFGSVRVRAGEDARPVAGEHRLVVLAPGLGFAAVQYQALAETLASHGSVVVGFTPTGSANVAVLGRRVLRQKASGSLPDGSLYAPSTRRRARRLLGTWVADARFVEQHARATLGDLGLSPGTTYVGHSFGGATALEACHEDRTCRAAANLDGLDLGPVTTTGLDVPTLLLGHDDSCVVGVCRPASADDRRDRALARAMTAAGAGHAWSVTLDGTQHFDFTDYAAYRVAWPLDRLLPLGPRPGASSLRLAESCVLDLVDETTSGCLRGRLPHTQETTWR